MHNYDTGWVLCHISMAFNWIPFKPQKGTPTIVTPSTVYIAIFSSFLQAVYPLGVTDLQPYFTQLIGHNSVNVHRIPTKLGTKIRLNEPFKFAKF